MLTICYKLSVAGALARTRPLFTEKPKPHIYIAQFASYMHYCSLVWTTKQNINKKFTLEKKAVRHTANLDYCYSPQIFSSCYNVIKQISCLLLFFFFTY